MTVFSEDRTYRYTLTRQWQAGRPEGTTVPYQQGCMFVCLNPSTADEHQDDPTVRRCIGYAKAWGYDSLTLCNLYGLRSTDPWQLQHHPAPIGPENDEWLQYAAAAHHEAHTPVVCAWGNHGEYEGRGAEVAALLAETGPLHVLALNSTGHPLHPLYAHGSLELQEWWRAT